MINVYLNPNREEDFPRSGGVREHLIQLKKFLSTSDKVQLLPYRAAPIAHIQHVEATYAAVIPNIPMIFTCHGGFLPAPVPAVIRNIQQADFITCVAQWVVDKFIPEEHWHKIAIIPNGADLAEFDDLPPSGLEPGYVLYGKDWQYYFEDFIQLTARLPQQRFVTVFWPTGQAIPSNVTYIGSQPRERMKSVIKDAGLLLLTGSEVNPIMLLEAWAAGTPVLAKNIDGSKEVMQPFLPDSSDIIGGMLYNSVREAAAFINYVLSDRDHLGLQGYNRVVEYYRWEDLIEKYEQVYETILMPA